jgi:hypothetical protein
MDKQLLAKTIGGASIGFGVAAVIAPDLLLKTYQFDTNPEVRGMARLWGTRNAVLGALLLRAQGRQLDDLLVSGAVLNGLDAALEFAGNKLDGTTGPGGAMAGATSAAFGVVSLLALRS